MKNQQEWFQEKTEKVSPEIMIEVQLSADIIARIDLLLKEKNMTQRELAQKLGKNESIVSRWTTGLPNYTLRTLSQLSVALGEPLIQIADH
jgi:transcriptional regulator with XRE-family HTH domain